MHHNLIAALGALAIAACATPASAPPAPVATAEEAPATMPLANYEATGWLAKTLPELSGALVRREITSVEVTQAYLERIAAIDDAGPRLQSILAVNPDALAQAAASDARRAAGTPIGPLDGVPILLKDNIETLDPIPTTAGSSALIDNVTGRDSAVAANLRASGDAL